MSQTHTETVKSIHPDEKPNEQKDEKKRDHTADTAMADADRHHLEGASVDPVPTPDHGDHAHSHAAHLGENKSGEAAYEGNVREGADPGVLSRTPEFQQRARATKSS